MEGVRVILCCIGDYIILNYLLPLSGKKKWSCALDHRMRIWGPCGRRVVLREEASREKQTKACLDSFINPLQLSWIRYKKNYGLFIFTLCIITVCLHICLSVCALCANLMPPETREGKEWLQPGFVNLLSWFGLSILSQQQRESSDSHWNFNSWI